LNRCLEFLKKEFKVTDHFKPNNSYYRLLGRVDGTESFFQLVGAALFKENNENILPNQNKKI
jgi:hypothetical protein